MKIIIKCYLTLVTFSNAVYGQDLKLFLVNYFPANANKPVGFISLSDIYPLNEHPDSLAIPDVEMMGIDSANYFELNAEYRKRFLTSTGISESEKVFIYDYTNNIHFSFNVKELPVVACINNYAGTDDWVFSQRDYMIGFEIDSIRLNDLSTHYNTSLVYVGNEDPFVQNEMKPIVWKKIKHEKIPFSDKDLKSMPWLSRMNVGNTYKFETKEYQYFVQDLIQLDIINGRHLLIIDLKTNKPICERIFHDSEGTSLAPLNYISPEYGNLLEQWTGNLFRNKAPVVFGFLYLSFGCPAITFLDNSENDLYIGCDNRH